MKNLAFCLTLMLLICFGMFTAIWYGFPNKIPTTIKIETEFWSGSGVFVEDDLILTAKHLVEDVNDIWIIWPDGKKHKAVSWYESTDADLAVVYIRSLEIEPTAKFCNAKIGENVKAIGAPFGYFPYTTQGIISAVDVNEPFFESGKLLMSDCPFNSGSSGCPLFNIRNQIVGIHVGGIHGADGIGFCIPAKTCQSVIERYRNAGSRLSEK